MSSISAEEYSMESQNQVLAEAIFRTLDAPSNDGVLTGSELDKACKVFGVSQDELEGAESVSKEEFLEWASEQEASDRDIADALVAAGGVVLEDWEQGELNEAMLLVDKDKSGDINGDDELKNLMFFAGFPKESAKHVLQRYAAAPSRSSRLTFAEVERFIMELKAYALLIYERGKEYFQDGPVSIEELRSECREYEEELGCPVPGMIECLLKNADSEGNDDGKISSTEFMHILVGRPKKSVQGLRDLQLCEGGKDEENDDYDEDADSNLGKVLNKRTAETLGALWDEDWTKIKDNFEKIFGLRLFMDYDAKDLEQNHWNIKGTKLTLAQQKACLNPRAGQSLVGMLQLVPLSTFKNGYWKDVIMLNDIYLKFACGGLAGSRVMWLNFSSGGLRKVFYHELYHLIDQNDNSMNDPCDKVWRSILPEGFKYVHERRPRAVCGTGARPKGFASSYGTTNVREDKATIMAMWMTDRTALRNLSEESDGSDDKILMEKIKLLSVELTRWDPNMQALFDDDALIKDPNLKDAHLLQEGDCVIANYPSYRGTASKGIFFKGKVTSIDYQKGTAAVEYVDGDTADSLWDWEIYYAPDAPDDVGKEGCSYGRNAGITELRKHFKCKAITLRKPNDDNAGDDEYDGEDGPDGCQYDEDNGDQYDGEDGDQYDEDNGDDQRDVDGDDY
eukprot:g1518.t1